MNVKTYRANTMQEALAQVRRDLGSKASVLHTREVPASGWLRWFQGGRQIEVVASTSVAVPSRLPRRVNAGEGAPAHENQPARAVARPPLKSMVEKMAGVLPSQDFGDQLARLQSRVDALCRRGGDATSELEDGAFHLFTDLIEADLSESLARELVDRAAAQAGDDPRDPQQLRALVVEMIEAEIAVAGPIGASPGRRHLVALVGPTGVGKTTTIAKLAANFRLRERRRVGLITVDTYRVAAVEQLRTYADIIDLPMEIVATPREMHQALARMADLDLVLMDTAGRSPRDEVKILELRAMLAEAAPDEVHLVLSSVASAASLAKTAEQFATVGTTALVLTKLDEAASLGNLLPLVRSSRLPLSYVTHGQNVPDDIAPAEAGRLARGILGLDPVLR